MHTNFPTNMPQVSIFLNVFFTAKFKKSCMTLEGTITVLRPKSKEPTELIDEGLRSLSIVGLLKFSLNLYCNIK